MQRAFQRKITFRFMAIVAFVVLSLTSLTLLLSDAQFGTHTKASFSLCYTVNARLAAAQRILDPKLVLIGGSGVRWGVNAGTIADEFGVPVLNFGLQAGLGPAILLGEAKKILRPGDTALLLFEFNHFVYDRLATIAVDYLYGCRRQYFSNLRLADRLKILFSVNPARVIGSLTFRPPENNCQNCTEEEDEAPAHGPVAVGDAPLTAKKFPPLHRDRVARMALYRPIPIALNRHGKGPQAIAAFVDWARANNVTVIASWPNTILFPEYEESAGFQAIADFYGSLGIPMIGEPSLGLLPLRYFYDTQYHLNIEGIRLRSRRLAEALRAHTASLPSGDQAAKQSGG